MNRAMRSAAARHKPAPRQYRKRIDGGLCAIGRSTNFSEHEFAVLSNEARMAWHKLQTGDATVAEYDSLVMAVNVTKILAEGFGTAAVEIMEHAQVALYEIAQRYRRTGRFGVDAFALKHMPDALDFHDECLRHCSPWQMTRALETAYERIDRARARSLPPA